MDRFGARPFLPRSELDGKGRGGAGKKRENRTDRPGGGCLRSVFGHSPSSGTGLLVDSTAEDIVGEYGWEGGGGGRGG